MGLIELYASLVKTEKEVERLKIVGSNGELPDKISELRRLRERLGEQEDRFESELGYLTRVIELKIEEGADLPKEELAAWKSLQRKYRSRTEQGLTAIDPVE